MKKSVKITIAVAVVLAAITVFSLLVPWWSPFALYHSGLRHYDAEYKEYSADFEKVKNLLVAQYPDVNGKCLSVVSKNGSMTFYDSDTCEYLVLPEDMSASVKVCTYDAFPEKSCDTVRIDGKRISFCLINGAYSLVYSPEEKPTWIHGQEEDDSVNVKRLGNGWYHVRRVQK